MIQAGMSSKSTILVHNQQKYGKTERARCIMNFSVAQKLLSVIHKTAASLLH
jgi:hypothetical protein